MPQFDAYISSGQMGKGVSLLICGVASAGDTLAVIAPNNERFEGQVILITPSNITILIDGKMFALDRWKLNDAPLPLWSGESSRWAAK